MKSRSSAFAVAIVFVTLTSTCFLVSRQSSISSPKFVAPSGLATPEGAACDYVGAYINRNFVRFTATRIHSFCETQQDIGRAYEALIDGDQPIHITQTRQSARAIRIVDVHPARAFQLTPCQQEFITAYMAIAHGGDRCMFVTVVTEDANGTQTDHCVDVVHNGNEWKVAREPLQSVARKAFPNAQGATPDWFGCPS